MWLTYFIISVFIFVRVLDGNFSIHLVLNVCFVLYMQTDTLDNIMPHYFGTLLPLYKSCIQAIQGYEHWLHQDTNRIYKHLIKLQALPLHLKIKRGQKYLKANYAGPFTNLCNPQIPIKPRELAFRIIYNMTLTFQRFAHRQNKIIQC